MKRFLGVVLALLALVSPVAAADKIILFGGSPSSGGGGGLTVGAAISGVCADSSFVYNNSGFVGCTAGGTTLTANGTLTSGFAANDILISDGTKLQKLTPGTGVAAALGSTAGGSGGFALQSSLGSYLPLTAGTGFPLTGILVNNLNVTVAPAAVAGTVVQFVGADGSAAFIENDSFGGTPIYTGRRADGTNASPTAVQSGDVLAGFSARPYDGTAYASASVANAQAVALENFTTAHHGAGVVINCTAITTLTTAECGRFTSAVLTVPAAALGGATLGSNALAVTGESSFASGTITTSVPAVNITQTWNNAATTFDAAFLVNVTNTSSTLASLVADFQTGGTSAVGFDAFGRAGFGSNRQLIGSYQSLFSNPVGGGGFFSPQLGAFGFYGANQALSLVTLDLTLFRDAAGILAQRNSTSAQSFRVYATASGSPGSNFQRLDIDAGQATANMATIGADNGGTGLGMGLNLTVAKTTGGGPTTAISVNTAGLTTLPLITSDAAQTDAAVCEDTTAHGLYSGSGTLGVCLGTSSLRYKHDLADLDVGLGAVMALRPKSYYLNADHGDPTKLYYGFTAEDGEKILPKLIGLDASGQPNTFDYLGLVPVLVKAVQQQQAEIAELKKELGH